MVPCRVDVRLEPGGEPAFEEPGARLDVSLGEGRARDTAVRRRPDRREPLEVGAQPVGVDAKRHRPIL